MKNITFNEQVNLFWKSKTKGTLGMLTQESTYVRSHDHAHAGTILHMYDRFQKHK